MSAGVGSHAAPLLPESDEELPLSSVLPAVVVEPASVSLAVVEDDPVDAVPDAVLGLVLDGPEVSPVDPASPLPSTPPSSPSAAQAINAVAPTKNSRLPE